MKTCPICDSENIDAEFVDIGVGEQQCTPYVCGDCGSWQVGPYDEPQPNLVIRFGWYVNPENPNLKETPCPRPTVDSLSDPRPA
jgi:hypothetical protein